MAKKVKVKKDALTRAIDAKKSAIARAEKRIALLYAAADEEAARIRKGSERTKVLLDALQRGALKP